jgi:hypothetical protein
MQAHRLEILLALGCQHDLSTEAAKQAHAQMGLQDLNLAADGAGRDRQPLGRAADALELARCLESS